jgi:hypothetical protein
MKIIKKDMITASRYVIHKKGENVIYGDNLEVSIEDDAAGYYFSITDQDGNNVKIDFKEVPELIEAINILKESINI